MAQRRLTAAEVAAFRRKVYRYFRDHRRQFSWRATRDPYHVLVSEIMLQQTQTDRVERKFKEFISAFPDLSALASAPLREVLRVWQGMGYNRRALYLQKAAREVLRRFEGALPQSVEELESLPGIGPATARSVAAYAFNAPVVFIETNIRAVYIHEFFRDRHGVSDMQLVPLVEQTLDRKDPWKWYNALMDYGVMLKGKHKNPARRSKHYKKQSPYLTSDRRVRGAILRCITDKGPLTLIQLAKESSFLRERLEKCLVALVREGMLEAKGKSYRIP